MNRQSNINGRDQRAARAIAAARAQRDLARRGERSLLMHTFRCNSENDLETPATVSISDFDDRPTTQIDDTGVTAPSFVRGEPAPEGCDA